jgi:hypothetical protein
VEEQAGHPHALLLPEGESIFPPTQVSE